jgi:GxxExxY protein
MAVSSAAVPIPKLLEQVGAEIVDAGYRIDLLVNGAVVVEVKSVDVLASIHQAQPITYLKLSGHRLGY